MPGFLRKICINLVLLLCTVFGVSGAFGFSQTVTLNNAGATTAGTGSLTVTSVSQTGTISNPARTGYDFGGYYTQRSCQGTQVINSSGSYTFTNATANEPNLFACWTPKNISLNLNQNSGSGGSPNTVCLKYNTGWYEYDNGCTGTQTTSITPPTRTGYIFNGYWSSSTGGVMVIDAAGKPVNTTAALTSYTQNGTLVARWIDVSDQWITVTFNGRSPTTSGTTVLYKNMAGAKANCDGWRTTPVCSGTTVYTSLPTAPTKTGYNFGGYYTQLNDTGTSNGTLMVNSSRVFQSAFNSLANNVVLYAKWEPKCLKISFSTSVPSSQTANASILYNNTVQKYAYLKYGVGWYADSSCTTSVTRLANFPTWSNSMYFVGFYNTYSNSNGSGTMVVDPGGYFLTTDTALKFRSTNGTIYAKRMANPSSYYTITLSKNNGNGSDYTIYEYPGVGFYRAAGGIQNVNNYISAGVFDSTDVGGAGFSKPTPAGITVNFFSGYYYPRTSGTQYIDATGKILVNSIGQNRTLYAYYSSGMVLLKGTTIEFDLGGGTSSCTLGLSRVLAGPLPNLSCVPTKQGYTFGGFTLNGTLAWNAAGESLIDNPAEGALTTLTATAVWDPLFKRAYYSCTDASSNNGYGVNDDTFFSSGNDYILPPIAEVGSSSPNTHCYTSHVDAGQIFLGYKLNNAGSLLQPGDAVTITNSNADALYPQWLTPITVTFDTSLELPPDNTPAPPSILMGGDYGSINFWDVNSPHAELTELSVIPYYYGADFDRYSCLHEHAGDYVTEAGGNGVFRHNYSGTFNTPPRGLYTERVKAISFDQNGGNGGQTNAIYYRSSVPGFTTTSDGTSLVTSVTKPTRTGYSFMGYYTGENGTGTQVFNASGNLNTTNYANGSEAQRVAVGTGVIGALLYANWNGNVYTIKLNKGHSDTSGYTVGTTTIYEKYATGWYSNSLATVSISSITKPTRTGYTFAGYYTQQNGGGTQVVNSSGTIVASNTTFTANTTVYANWTPKTNTVSFNANGGTGGQTANVTATFGQPMPTISSTAPTRAGYTFVGWYDNQDYESGTQYYTAAGASARNWDKTSNTTLYAGWTPRCNAITVHIKARGGYLPGHTTEEDVILYRHSGHIDNADWWTDDNCSSTRVKNFAEVSPYFTLPKKDNAGFAGVYSNNTDGYAVDYPADYVAKDGSFQDIDINSDVEAWAHFICEPDYAENGKDIKRLCEKNYTLHLDSEGADTNGTDTLYTIHNVAAYLNSLRTEGQEMTPSAYPITLPTKTGYSFDGYFSNTSGTLGGTGTQYVSNTGYITNDGINAAISYSNNNSKWYAKMGPNTYTVRFMSGSTELGTQSFTYGTAQELTSIAQLSNIPVSASNNWIFDGWATSSNTPNTAYTDRQSVSNLTATNGATVNLYAVWHRNIPFKYYTNATATTATTAYKTQFYYNAVATSVSPSDLALVTSTQSNSNWTPLGWVSTTSVTGSTTATLATNGSVTPAAGSAMPTYYALYSRTPSISYNANGGSGTTNATTCGVQKIAATGTASTSSCTLASNGFTAPTGYYFDKWRTGATSGSEYAAGATNYSFPNRTWASNMTGTLYAKWVGNTITLNWNENGGDAISDGSCTYGGNLTLPAAPTYIGYTFNGWNLANNTTQSAGTTITGGCTSTYTGVTSGTSTSIQAQWTPQTSTVILNPNGGTAGSVTSVTATYDAAMPTISGVGAFPTLTGYTFIGYYDATSGGTKYYNANGTSARNWDKTGDQTLYAQWKANCNAITINVAANGGTLGGSADSVTLYKYTDDATWSTHELCRPRDAVTNLDFFYSDLPAKTNAIYSGTYENQGTPTGAQAIAADGTLSTTWNPTGNTTIYAHYNCNTNYQGSGIDISGTCNANTYTITYNNMANATNYSGAPNNYTYGVGATIDGVPSRAHSTFGGWCTDSALQNCASSQTISNTATGNKEFYANWTCNEGYTSNSGNTACIANTCTVTFKTGNTTLGTQNFTYGTAQSLTAIASLSNVPANLTNYWTFYGWSTGADATREYTNGQSLSNLCTTNGGSITLYGIWQRDVSFKYYNSATATSTTTSTRTQSYYNTNTTTASANSVSTYALYTSTQASSGWAPLGWATSTSATSASVEQTGSTTTTVAPAWSAAAPTYYAVYSRTPEVSYAKNCSSATGSTSNSTCGAQTYNAGGTAGSSSSCTLANNGFSLSNATFSKWAAGSATGTQYAAGASYTFPNTGWATNKTYSSMYAYWNANAGYHNTDGGCVSANTCTVTFKTGNTTLGTQNFTYGTAQALTAVSGMNNIPVSGNGWTFHGWSTSVNSTSTTYTDGQSLNNLCTNGNITLYGIWKRPVTFKYYNGASATTVTTNNSQTQYYRNTDTTTADVTSVNTYALVTQSTYDWAPQGWVLNSTSSTTLASDATTNTTSVTPAANGGANYYALYKRTATLKYNGNTNTGGSTADTTGNQYYNAGASAANALSLTLRANGFTKTGYSFSKWAAGSTSGTQYSAGTSFTFPNTAWTSSNTYNGMYAIWTANCNAITLNANGGTAGSITTLYKKSDLGTWYTNSTCTTEYATTTNIKPTRSGYAFRGFYSTDLNDVTSDANNGTQYITTAGATTTAGNNYTVTGVDTIYAAWAQNCTNPVSNGTCNLSVSAAGVVDYTTSCSTNYTITSASNNTYNPICNANVYTITLNDATNGGANGSGIVYEKYATGWSLTNFGTTVNNVAIPTKSNSVFTGYRDAATNGNNKIPLSGTLPAATTFTSDATLYAQFESCTCTKGDNVKTCTVSGVENNKCQYTYTCNDGYHVGSSGTTATGSFAATNAGVGSNTSPSCSGNTITLSYANGGHGSTPAAGSCTYDSTFNMPAALTATGYTFDKWNVNNNTFNGGQTSVACNYTNLGIYSGTATITASWTANTNIAYKVYHYTKDLGATTYTQDGEYDSLTGTSDASVTLSTLARSITGFRYDKGFAGTTTSATMPAANTAVTTTTILADGTRVISLYYTRNSYTLRLYMGVGISAVTGGGTYEYGANVSIDATVKNGYTWSNWRHTVTGGAQVSTTKNYAFVMPASDQDYTAVATLDTYTITYNLDGGSHGTTHPSSYTVITSDITLSNPTKTGYTFAGWRVTTAPTAWGTGSSASGSTNFKIATGTYGNIAFEATWVADVYTITLSDGAGTSQSGAPSPIYLKYNDGWYNDSVATTGISTLITTPIKVGYLFEGYYKNSDGSGAQVINNAGAIVANNTAFTANATIYAKYTAQTGFSVTTTNLVANTPFKFAISAAGQFYVDWGDGTVESLNRENNTTETLVSHTYTTAGAKTVTIYGRATGYNTGNSVAAIRFGADANALAGVTNTLVAGISGSLATVFPTISSTQPKFVRTFGTCTNLTGSVPSDVFSGLSGAPVANMFLGTFESDIGLTGTIPAGLFSAVSGAVQTGTFKDTFKGCANLTGYVPRGLFATFTGGGVADTHTDMFVNSGLATECPCGMTQYTTGFENTDGKINTKVSCQIGIKTGEYWHNGHCVTECAAGITRLKTSNGLSVPLLRAKVGTKNMAFKHNDTICYSPVETGNVSGHINLKQGANIYHVSEPDGQVPSSFSSLPDGVLPTGYTVE